MAEVYRAQEHGFTASEYDRARTEFLSQVAKQYENRDKAENPTYIHECVRNFLDNDPMPGIEFENMLYNAMAPQVPVEMVNEMFKQLVSVSDTNLVVLSVNPEKEGYVQPTEAQLLAAIHEAQQMHLEAYVDNVKNEPLIAKLPEPGEIVRDAEGPYDTRMLHLSNGVRVILKKTDFKDNEVLMRAYSDGGIGRYGVEEKYNLALAPTLVGASGLGNFTDTELQKALAGVQAHVRPSFTARSEYLTGNAVPKDLRTLFELTYLHFQPLYRDDKAAQSALAQTAEVLRNQAANPMKAFNDSLQTTLYGAENPYLVILKEEDLQQVNYERVLDLYKDRFASADDFTFVFVGNFDNDSIRQYICQYLATLPVVKRDDKPVDNGFNIRFGQYTNRFTKKMEEPKSQLVEIFQAPIENTLQNQIVADALGQVLTMRYLELIREDMGAAYSCGASCGISKISDGSCRATIQVYAPLKPEMCDTVLKVIDQELESIARNGIDDEKYLSKVREYLLKTFTENERRNDTWLGYIEDWDRDGIDEYSPCTAFVSTLTSDDIAQMARRILDAKNHIIVVMLPE